jgi:hypothetical protein
MFKTKNIVLASTLLTTGEGLIDLKIDNQNNKPEGIFYFEETESLKVAVKGFYDNRLRVEPRIFSVNFKDLKANVYEQIRQKQTS